MGQSRACSNSARSLLTRLSEPHHVARAHRNTTLQCSGVTMNVGHNRQLNVIIIIN